MPTGNAACDKCVTTNTLQTTELKHLDSRWCSRFGGKQRWHLRQHGLWRVSIFARAQQFHFLVGEQSSKAIVVKYKRGQSTAVATGHENRRAAINAPGAVCDMLGKDVTSSHDCTRSTQPPHRHATILRREETIRAHTLSQTDSQTWLPNANTASVFRPFTAHTGSARCSLL
jgi:hypothetical protein